MWDLGRVKANKNQHHDVRCVSILSKLISSAICTYPYVWYVTTLQWYISESHVVRVYMLLFFFSLTDTKYIYRSLGQFKNGDRETETKMERNGKVKSKIMTEKIWKKWRSKGKKCEMWFMDRFAPKSFTVIGFDFVKMRYINLCCCSTDRALQKQRVLHVKRERENISSPKKGIPNNNQVAFCTLKFYRIKVLLCCSILQLFWLRILAFTW